MKKSNIFYIIFILILILIMMHIYGTYYFNDYSKAVKEPEKTSFYRDNKIKHNMQKSYCIESTEYNTALFSKYVSVKKNTPYRLTCYIKTEDVENNTENKAGGANICIADTVEKSESFVGDNDWTRVEFMFNSKNRNSIEIAFRLGSYDTDSKGKAWFSDIVLEEGVADENNTWNMAFFVFKNIDITIDENIYNTSMDNEDIQLIEKNIQRFKKSMSELSENKINIEYSTYYVDKPLDTISYDESNGYYFDSIDVYDKIIDQVKYNNFDHIFIIFESEDINKSSEKALENDWVGLGGMDFLEIGFSNIRLPEKEGRHMYEYKTYHTFPEEVFVHEFLHTLERNSNEFGLDIPKLHDYKDYGYENSDSVGLKNWYADYMNKRILYNGEYVGIDESLYTVSKPCNQVNFVNSEEIEFDKEPENIVQTVKLFIYNSKILIERLREGVFVKT